MPEWTYDPRVHRYRDQRGRYVSPTTMTALRNDAVERSRSRVTALATRLTAGEVTVQEWLVTMRQEVKDHQTMQYLFGRGGRQAATSADRTAIAALVAAQWEYLQGFAAAVQAGRLTPRQISARAQLYLDQAVHGYERGRAASHGLSLPAYPADGQTRCKARCKCSWSITETATAWRCTWTLHAAESCPDCLARASRWRRLVIRKADQEGEQQVSARSAALGAPRTRSPLRPFISPVARYIAFDRPVRPDPVRAGGQRPPLTMLPRPAATRWPTHLPERSRE